MNKLAIALVPLAFTIVLLFSGCSLFQSEESTNLFVGGDKALEFKFSTNAPPSQVRQGELFDISIFVENKGESAVDINELMVDLNNGAIFDVKPEDFTKKNQDKLNAVVKQESGYLPGGSTYLEYTNLKYIGQETLTEQTPIALSLEACYPYKTIGISNICVAREAESSSSCTPTGEKAIEASGAPVRINKLEQQSNGVLRASGLTVAEKDTVTTRITVELSKTGNARIYPLDYSCETKAGFGEGVTIKSITVDNLKLDVNQSCGDNTVFFDENGNSKFFCTLKIPNVKSDYEGRFAIVLSYKISEVLNKEVSILPY